jgi:hypothetical protein
LAYRIPDQLEASQMELNPEVDPMRKDRRDGWFIVVVYS